jgi:hypothetical protein
MYNTDPKNIHMCRPVFYLALAYGTHNEVSGSKVHTERISAREDVDGT